MQFGWRLGLVNGPNQFGLDRGIDPAGTQLAQSSMDVRWRDVEEPSRVSHGADNIELPKNKENATDGTLFG
jgi:hypothetical protein